MGAAPRLLSCFSAIAAHPMVKSGSRLLEYPMKALTLDLLAALTIAAALTVLALDYFDVLVR